MTGILERDSYDPRPVEIRRIVVAGLILLVFAAAWHGLRGRLLYEAACTSVGCPGREQLIAAALRRADPRFPDQPQFWRYSLAHPDWIAWSSVGDVTRLADGSQLAKWQVTVADRRLAVRGAFVGSWLSTPPTDADGDGSCEVVKEIVPRQDDAQRDIVWWVVLRLGDQRNQIVSVGQVDWQVWHSRQMRLKPIWRDEDGDGQDEFVFITVETTRTPQGGIVFKPPQTIAVFEWTAPGGILRPRSLPDDYGIRVWNLPDGAPMQVDQAADLDQLARDLLPADQ